MDSWRVVIDYGATDTELRRFCEEHAIRYQAAFMRANDAHAQHPVLVRAVFEVGQRDGLIEHYCATWAIEYHCIPAGE